MKKSLFLSAIILSAALPALAAVDVNEYNSPEYLYNAGYSSEAIKLIQYNKSFANGEDLRARELNKVRNRSVFTKFMDYLDPSRDDGKFMIRDIELKTPNYEDL